MPLHTDLGLQLPLVQAPMAGVSGVPLAVAIAKAGGLGSLPCAMLDNATIIAHIESFRNQVNAPVNLNFFCHSPPAPDPQQQQRWRQRLQPFYTELGLEPESLPDSAGRKPFSEETADLVAQLKPEVVSFHFGLPEQSLLDTVRASSALILSSATTVEEAQWLQDHGCDAVIAQGLEAGGHRGLFLSSNLSRQRDLATLLPAIIQAVDIPVIAAGGIAAVEDVTQALATGASAVQIGTSFLLCPECDTSAVHRSALISADSEHTALTNVFSGRPARSIVNRAVRELGPISTEAPAFPTAGLALAPLRQHSEQLGDGDWSPLWCGQRAQGCKPIAAQTLARELFEWIKIVD